MKKVLVLGLLLLFAVPAGAAAPRILPYQDAWPTWSPDGRSIAFTRVHAARNLMELEVVDLTSRRVTKLAQNGWQLQPSWAPDGKSIAYQAGGSVYVTDLNGRKRRIGAGGAPAYGETIARIQSLKLLVDGAVWAEHVIGRPAWSPDGKTIAFRRDDGIYTATGPGDVRLLVGASEPGDPVWSPDGAQIAFATRGEVWVASRGLVPAHAIARAKPDAATPSWSPDGAAVVYTWRGGVTLTTLAGRSTLLHRAAGLGAAFSPVSDVVAYAGPRPACPGHISITIQGPVAGTCEVQGTAAADVLEGSASWGDVVLGRGGNDKIHANDGHTDRVDCGAGHDEVWADKVDKLAHCEVVHR